MIKLMFKLIVMVVVVRRGDYRVEGLLSLLVFSVFATVDDEIIAKSSGPCERKTRGQIQITRLHVP